MFNIMDTLVETLLSNLPAELDVPDVELEQWDDFETGSADVLLAFDVIVPISDEIVDVLGCVLIDHDGSVIYEVFDD